MRQRGWKGRWKGRRCGRRRPSLTKKLLVCEDLPHCKRYLGTCGPFRIINSDVSSVLGARAYGDGLEINSNHKVQEERKKKWWAEKGRPSQEVDLHPIADDSAALFEDLACLSHDVTAC